MKNMLSYTAFEPFKCKINDSTHMEQQNTFLMRCHPQYLSHIERSLQLCSSLVCCLLAWNSLVVSLDSLAANQGRQPCFKLKAACSKLHHIVVVPFSACFWWTCDHVFVGNLILQWHILYFCPRELVETFFSACGRGACHKLIFLHLSRDQPQRCIVLFLDLMACHSPNEVDGFWVKSKSLYAHSTTWQIWLTCSVLAGSGIKKIHNYMFSNVKCSLLQCAFIIAMLNVCYNYVCNVQC